MTEPLPASHDAEQPPPPLEPAQPRERLTKMEPGWRGLHRIRSGIVLTLAAVALAALLAAAIGLAVAATAVTVSHAVKSSSTTP